MKDNDKITLTDGQIKRLIKESRTEWRPKFDIGDYIVNKRDREEVFRIRDITFDRDIYGCCYDAEYVNPKTLKPEHMSIDIWAVDPGDDYAYEGQFRLYRIK